MIIAILNQKGGVGKSTLSISLAAALAAKHNVLLIDSDPQGSSLDWSVKRQEPCAFATIGMPRATMHKEIPKMLQGFDHIVIDGAAGKDSILAKSAIMASDIVLIPVQPSPMDIWASHDIVNLVSESQQFREGLKAFFVVNRTMTNTVIGKDARKALAGYPYPVLKTQVMHRIIFAESVARGETIFEADGEGKAALNIISLMDELIGEENK